ICILIQACVPAFEKILTMMNPTGELTMPVVILLLISACKMLPFAGVVCWNWYQDTMTKNKAIATVILAPALYVLVSCLVSWIIRVVAARVFGISAFQTYILILNVQDVFSLLLLAALVLICCACAIDLYVLKYPVNTQNQ
ncbi:MAG: hypothetical protein K2I93_04650, partial [Oscillospiraceae bacterium]|nr:hypothetical protein [Oscillospiraceae bacterium]